MDLNDNTLISLDEYRAYRQKDDDTEMPDGITFLINSVSTLIENHLNRIVCPTTDVSEIFDGDGEANYYVKNRRITTDPTLYWWSGTEWTELTSDTYPRAYDGGQVWFNQGDIFSTGTKNYKIAYNTGWDQADVPHSIKTACCVLVHRAELKATSKEGVASESFGDQTTSFSLSKMPEDVSQMLSPYRRISVG